MNRIQSCILILFLFFCLVGCNKENGVSPTNLVIDNTENTINILPLGDSRVEGNRPDFESYRFELWKQLIEQNFNVDFVGTRIDDSNYPCDT